MITWIYLIFHNIRHSFQFCCRLNRLSWLACSSQVWQVMGSSPVRVKPKTIKLVFDTSLLSMQHLGRRANTGWHVIRIVCPCVQRYFYPRTVLFVRYKAEFINITSNERYSIFNICNQRVHRQLYHASLISVCSHCQLIYCLYQMNNNVKTCNIQILTFIQTHDFSGYKTQWYANNIYRYRVT